MNSQAVGILGLGTFLPSEVRTNTWWDEAIVEEWRRKAQRLRAWLESEEGPETPGARITRERWLRVVDDPFQGAVERRIKPRGMLSSELETRAAEDAIYHTGIDRSEIGLLLCHSVCPDYLNTPNACLVHRKLQLNPRCTSISVDGMCNAFMLQLELAQAHIAAGKTKYALLVQSSTLPDLVPNTDAPSAWFGDGATASILGAVEDGFGILSQATRTKGDTHDCLVFGVRDQRWFDAGPVVLYARDPTAAHELLLEVVERSVGVTGEALRAAGLDAQDIDFLGTHQATVWFREAVLERLDMTTARSCDIFTWAGSLSSANLPLQLAVAEREGLLKHGDLVSLFSGGTGETYSAACMRWSAKRSTSPQS